MNAPDPPERGRTDISDQVVERIVGQAIAEVDRAGGFARRVLGVRLSRESPDRTAHSSAEVNGGVVTVDVQMSVIYPASVRRIAATARENIRERVARLTGLTVAYVDIEVARLLPPAQRGRRVE